MILAVDGPSTSGRLAAPLDNAPCLPSRSTYHTEALERRRRWLLKDAKRPVGGRVYRALSDDDERMINLDMAASTFAKGAAAGTDADDLVAQQLGAGSASQMTETQDRYKDKIKAKLEERAQELRKEQEARAIKFTQGKAAYARGQYDASVKFLESALNEEGPFSQLGGEIQMWLALAYQACGREEECITTYKAIENTHPVPAIRRKAAELRYIMEAPKLEIREDEKVKIPVLTDLDPNRGGRAPPPRPRVAQKQQRPKSWDEEFWENYEPPKYLKNRYVWAAAVIVTLGLAWYSASVSP